MAAPGQNGERVRSSVGGRAVARALWAIALAGFVLYLADFGSIDETYRSLGTTALTFMWLILFSVLYYATPRLNSAAAPTPAPDAATELERLVRIALQDDAAHRGMWSAGRPGEVPALLTEAECDLNDWGFTYGVAWAVARRQYPAESDRHVAERALEAARAVFGEYCAEEKWPEPPAERELAGSSPPKK
jgi:hypothetical protein